MNEILKHKIDEVTKASYRMKNLHIQLKALENKGLHDTALFTQLLLFLDIATESFLEIYKDQRFNYDELCTAYKFFYQNHQRIALYDYNEILDPNNFKDGFALVYAMIEQKFKNLSDKDVRLTSLDTSEVRKITDNNSFIKDDLNRNFATHSLISNDLILTALFLIDDFIKRNPSHPCQSDLLSAKHHLGFINLTLGNILRSRNYLINEPIFIGNMDLMVDINDFEDTFFFDYYKQKFLDDLLTRQIRDLAEEGSFKTEYETLIRQILIKSCLINFDVKDIIDYQMYFEARKRNNSNEYPNSILIRDTIEDGINLYSSKYFIRYKTKAFEKTKKGSINGNI